VIIGTWKSICVFIVLAAVSPVNSGHVSAAVLSGRFTGIFEPSGIEQNGAVTLIIEDEKDQPLHVLSGFSQAMAPVTRRLKRCGTTLDDLEGIAANGAFFYLAGSHQPKPDGSRRKKRELFVRLTVRNDSCEALISSPSLYEAIRATLMRATGGQLTTPFQVNIEALAWKHGTGQLYIGLRQPLMRGSAILLILENPRELFEDNAAPVFSEQPVLLPLGGGAIRAMSYIGDLGGYLIANETPDGAGIKHSNLWFWQGGEASPVQMKPPEIRKMENIEGISSFEHDGQAAVIIVSDDGSRKKKKGGHYVVIPISNFQKSIQH